MYDYFVMYVKVAGHWIEYDSRLLPWPYNLQRQAIEHVRELSLHFFIEYHHEPPYN